MISHIFKPVSVAEGSGSLCICSTNPVDSWAGVVHKQRCRKSTAKVAVNFMATQETYGKTNRGIGAHILRYTSCFTNLAVELVLKDTVGGRGLIDMASPAGKNERIRRSVFFWVE